MDFSQLKENISTDILLENIKVNFDNYYDLSSSFDWLIRKENGLYKSGKQAWFLYDKSFEDAPKIDNTIQTQVSPYFTLSDNNKLVMINGIKKPTYLIDGFGVVAKFYLNPFKLEWQRPSEIQQQEETKYNKWYKDNKEKIEFVTKILKDDPMTDLSTIDRVNSQGLNYLYQKADRLKDSTKKIYFSPDWVKTQIEVQIDSNGASLEENKTGYYGYRTAESYRIRGNPTLFREKFSTRLGKGTLEKQIIGISTDKLLTQEYQKEGVPLEIINKEFIDKNLKELNSKKIINNNKLDLYPFKEFVEETIIDMLKGNKVTLIGTFKSNGNYIFGQRVKLKEIL